MTAYPLHLHYRLQFDDKPSSLAQAILLSRTANSSNAIVQRKLTLQDGVLG